MRSEVADAGFLPEIVSSTHKPRFNRGASVNGLIESAVLIFRSVGQKPR